MRKFAKWGKVANIYVAEKRNKEGKIFGFVCYEGVVDKEWLVNQLNNI